MDFFGTAAPPSQTGRNNIASAHSYDEVISESGDLMKKFTRLREDAIVERKALIRTGADRRAVAEVEERIRSYERVIDTAGSVIDNMSGMKKNSLSVSRRKKKDSQLSGSGLLGFFGKKR